MIAMTISRRVIIFSSQIPLSHTVRSLRIVLHEKTRHTECRAVVLFLPIPCSFSFGPELSGGAYRYLFLEVYNQKNGPGGPYWLVYPINYCIPAISRDITSRGWLLRFPYLVAALN